MKKNLKIGVIGIMGIMSVCCKFTSESTSEKKFENRLTFGEVMGKSLVSCFLTHYHSWCKKG